MAMELGISQTTGNSPINAIVSAFLTCVPVDMIAAHSSRVESTGGGRMSHVAWMRETARRQKQRRLCGGKWGTGPRGGVLGRGTRTVGVQSCVPVSEWCLDARVY